MLEIWKRFRSRTRIKVCHVFCKAWKPKWKTSRHTHSTRGYSAPVQSSKNMSQSLITALSQAIVWPSSCLFVLENSCGVANRLQTGAFRCAFLIYIYMLQRIILPAPVAYSTWRFIERPTVWKTELKWGIAFQILQYGSNAHSQWNCRQVFLVVASLSSQSSLPRRWWE